MALLKAKCTNCGADLQVDGSKDAAVCPYCGSAFIVEKAIANFYGSNVGSINASVVNIYSQDAKPSVSNSSKAGDSEKNLTQPSKEFLKKVSVACRFSKALQQNLFLKSDGTLGLLSSVKFGIPTGIPWLFNLNVFKWSGLKDFRLIICTHVDVDEPFVAAMTYDGKCYADVLYLQEERRNIPSECFELFKTVRSWSNIIQLCQYGKHFVGLRSDGTVVTTWGDPELAGWRNVKKLACYESGRYWDEIGDTAGLLGLTNDGKVLAYGVYNWQKTAYSQWSDINDISFGYGLTKNRYIVEPTIEDPMHIITKNALSLKNTTPDPDGSFSYKKSNGSYNVLFWDTVAKLGKGYVYSDGVYYLHEDGRVDEIKNYSINREIESDVIACIHIPAGYKDNIGYLKSDGHIHCSYLEESIPLLAGDPADYGRRLSVPVHDAITQKFLVNNYNGIISQCESIKRSRGLFAKKGDLNEKITLCEKCLRELEMM